MCNIQLAAEIH